MTAEKYNGWANRATWNVALWLENDEGLYRMALAAAKSQKHLTTAYAKAFVETVLPHGTPDNVPMSQVRYSEIAAMMRELGEE